MTTLAHLEALAAHIGDLEKRGDHDNAAVYWDLFSDAVDEMPEPALKAAVKQLLVARSDSSVNLAGGPRDLFARAAT